MTARAHHGTNSRYTAGCRCDECRAGHAEYQRIYNARHRKERPTVLDRFFAGVAGFGNIPTGFDSPCVLWGRALNRDGYGHIRIGDAKAIVHRYAYEAFVGPIPGDLTIDHLCRVTNCVNPAHLEPVTASENVRRANAARFAA